MDPYAGFAAIYDEWSASMTEDVAFHVELACEAEALYAWFDPRPFDDSSCGLVYMARKPA